MFSADDFGVYHPGGTLGANLTRVRELMHTGDAIPLVAVGSSLEEAVTELSNKKLGCVGIVEKDGSLAGLSNISQRGVNDNNRLQAKPMENCVLGAIRRAAPFTSLDPAYYDVWKSHKTAFKGR